jgi:hypothetical protein
VCLGEPGVDTNRGAAAFDRPLVLTQAAVGFGQIGMESRDPWPQYHRPADQLDCSEKMPALMVHDTKIVQGIGVVGIMRQHAVIAPSRVGMAAGSVQLEGSGKRRGHHKISQRDRTRR